MSALGPGGSTAGCSLYTPPQAVSKAVVRSESVRCCFIVRSLIYEWAGCLFRFRRKRDGDYCRFVIKLSSMVCLRFVRVVEMPGEAGVAAGRGGGGIFERIGAGVDVEAAFAAGDAGVEQFAA